MDTFKIKNMVPVINGGAWNGFVRIISRVKGYSMRFIKGRQSNSISFRSEVAAVRQKYLTKTADFLGCRTGLKERVVIY